MHKFDFLSGAPKTLIFERKSNKTNLGGVLTLIYLIIVLLIILGYIYDYSMTQLYTISYSYDYQVHYDEDYMIERYKNESLNPKINFTFQIFKVDGTELNENNFGIVFEDQIKNYKQEEIQFNKNNEAMVYSLNFYLYYKCKSYIDGNCTIRDEDKSELNLYYLHFNYLGFKLEHQNEETPIKRENRTNEYIFSINDQISLHTLRWKTIIYKEEIGGITGLFSNLKGENNYIYGGEFLDHITFIINGKEAGMEPEEGQKVLSYITMNLYDPQNYYDIYSRKKKSIFNSIANICSLSLTIYNAIIFVFCGFYSNNFDDYKIIDRILFKAKIEKNNKIDYNLNDNIINDNGNADEDNELNEDNNQITELPNVNDNNDSLIDKDNIEDKIILKEKVDIKKDNRILPKYHFWDFFFNNIYIKKCCSSKRQELISTCNEIISKYYSIDCIVYNQLLLENLFKDYKWNNPKLNTISNNPLVKDLNI